MQVKSDTFGTARDTTQLQNLIHKALKALSGSPRGGAYAVPTKLTKLGRPTPGGEPARLLRNYREIWKQCFIVYDEKEKGASIHMPTGKISFGPFFLGGWSVRDLEKVILHEFLHKAIALQPTYGDARFRKEAQHGEIDHIIQYELKYPGNPRGGRVD